MQGLGHEECCASSYGRYASESHVSWGAGHVVACRITSEDANDGFKPTCGLIDELSFRSTPEVWGYFSVKSGGGIHEFSDSQVRGATDP